jgi:glycosyltransferase involved in cell wall biosynthesis
VLRRLRAFSRKMLGPPAAATGSQGEVATAQGGLPHALDASGSANALTEASKHLRASRKQMIQAAVEASYRGDRDALLDFIRTDTPAYWPHHRARHRKPSRAIWKALIRVGEVELALDYLSSDLFPSSGPIPNQRYSDPASRAVILDPGLRASVPGHHYNTNLMYTRLLRDLGLPSVVYSARDCKEGKEFSEISAFTSRVYPAAEPVSRDWLLNLNRYFALELERYVKADGAALIVFPTLRHTTILGAATWLAEVTRHMPTASVLGVIDSALCVESSERDIIDGIYVQAIKQLCSVPQIPLLVYVETDQHAEHLQRLSRGVLDVRIFRYIASTLALDHADRPRAKTVHGLNIGFVGASRAERGAHLIPDIVKASLDFLPITASWIVQLSRAQLETQKQDLSGLEYLASLERCTLLTERLTTEDYFLRLAEIDILVLPYTSRYEATGSGVFIEALTLGKVVIVPAAGWMPSLLRRLGSHPVTFEEPSVDCVSAAIQFAVEHYDALKVSAREAGARWNQEESGAAQLQAWIETLPVPLPA